MYIYLQTKENGYNLENNYAWESQEVLLFRWSLKKWMELVLKKIPAPPPPLNWIKKKERVISTSFWNHIKMYPQTAFC